MPVVKFRCIQSGNIVAFSDETDIESMRREPHYEEIKDGSSYTPTVDASHSDHAPTDQVKKARGRPPKQDIVV